MSRTVEMSQTIHEPANNKASTNSGAITQNSSLWFVFWSVERRGIMSAYITHTELTPVGPFRSNQSFCTFPVFNGAETMTYVHSCLAQCCFPRDLWSWALWGINCVPVHCSVIWSQLVALKRFQSWRRYSRSGCDACTGIFLIKGPDEFVGGCLKLADQHHSGESSRSSGEIKKTGHQRWCLNFICFSLK